MIFHWLYCLMRFTNILVMPVQFYESTSNSKTAREHQGVYTCTSGRYRRRVGRVGVAVAVGVMVGVGVAVGVVVGVGVAVGVMVGVGVAVDVDVIVGVLVGVGVGSSVSVGVGEGSLLASPTLPL